MSFLIYFAVLIVAAAGALFGLDLATSPLPPQKPAAQVSENAPNKLARREAEQRDSKQGDATRELTPIYPANPGGGKEVRMVYPPTTDTAAAPPAKDDAGTAMAKTDEPSQPAPQPTVTAAQPAAASAPAQPAAPAAQPEPQPTIQPAMQTQAQAPNQCDVQACTSAYRSFRASDCTYQPFEGPRRVCEGAPSRSAEHVARDSEPRRNVSVRRSGRQADREADREAELDAVAQRVKEITGGNRSRRVYASDDVDFDVDDGTPRRRVIVIERGGGLWR